MPSKKRNPQPKSQTPVAVLLEKMAAENGGQRVQITRQVLQTAAKKLKDQPEEAVRQFLLENQGRDTTQPPAKCNIVHWSRPLTEWPIVKISEAIQRAIYDLPFENFNKLKEQGMFRPDAPNRDRLFRELRVNIDPKLFHAQGLNPIIKHAIRRYEGVKKRIENQNEERRQKFDRINAKLISHGHEPEKFIPKAVFDDQGCLSEKPGINPNFYGYNQIRPRLLLSAAAEGIELPEGFEDYGLIPDKPLRIPGQRLDIPEGAPGYVPGWQRDPKPRVGQPLSTNKHKRIRAWYSNQKLKSKPNRRTDWRTMSAERRALAAKERAQGSILAILRIGQDWVVFDLQGSLRNAHWRRLIAKTANPSDILDLFTGDPVINTTTKVVTMLYKSGKTGVVPTRLVSGYEWGHAKLRDLTKPDADGRPQKIGVVTVDLGQTNPYAAGFYRVGQTPDGELTHTRLDPWWKLPKELEDELRSYRSRHNEMERYLNKAAIAALTPEQQVEYLAYEGSLVENTKQRVCDHLGLDPASLPWDRMGPNTTFLSNAYLAKGGAKADIEFTHPPKSRKCKEKTCKHTLSQHTEAGCKCCECKFVPPVRKDTSEPPITEVRTDENWSRHLRRKLSEETRRAHTRARRELQQVEPGYQKLATGKTQLARRSANALLQEARHRTQCKTIVVVIEDLTLPIFGGKNKRRPGWQGFFSPKEENRWFIQANHKALSSLPGEKGVWVIQLWPAGTSITCPVPMCQHRDKASRDGEAFLCTKCKEPFHADGEVATHNLFTLVLTGRPLPKPEVEPAGGAKPARSVRAPKAPPKARRETASFAENRAEESAIAAE